MAYTYDEDGSMSQSIMERQRKKERDQQMKQQSKDFYNRHNKLKRPNGS